MPSSQDNGSHQIGVTLPDPDTRDRNFPKEHSGSEQAVGWRVKSRRVDSWKRCGRGGAEGRVLCPEDGQGLEMVLVPHTLPQLAFAKASLLINLGDAKCFFSESNAFYRLINSYTYCPRLA